MLSFEEFIKESSADFNPALKNFQSQVLSSPGYYVSMSNLKTAAAISGNEAMQLQDGTPGDPMFDDSKMAFVKFSGSGLSNFVVSIDKANGNIVMGKEYFSHDSRNIFTGFRWEQKKNEKRFQNVTLYLSGTFMGNIHRMDCKELIVSVGKYAQYDRAINLKYLQKGKQKWRETWVASQYPFCVVVPTAKAINPDEMYGPEEAGSVPGVTVSRSKYSAFDPRWESDFIAALKAKHVPVVFSHNDVK